MLIGEAIGSPIAVFRIAKARNLAQSERDRADQSLYDSDMSLAQRAWDDGDLGSALNRLQAHLPRAETRDRRSFEWYYFWKLCQGEQRITLTNHNI